MSDIQNEFFNYGKNMLVVAICTILTIIPWAGIAMQVVVLVFLFMAIGTLRDANVKLNSPLIEQHNSKLTAAIIVGIIGAFINFIGGFWIPFNLFNPFYWGLYAVNMIFLIISSAIEMGAWRLLYEFFNSNKGMFPKNLEQEAIGGCENLRTGALLYALGFLVVTIFIGWIFQIIGFFKLANFRNLTGVYTQEPYSEPSEVSPVTEPTPEPTIAPALTPQFCPNCGAEVKGAGNFCGECGSQIK